MTNTTQTNGGRDISVINRIAQEIAGFAIVADTDTVSLVDSNAKGSRARS